MSKYGGGSSQKRWQFKNPVDYREAVPSQSPGSPSAAHPGLPMPMVRDYREAVASQSPGSPSAAHPGLPTPMVRDYREAVTFQSPGSPSAAHPGLPTCLPRATPKGFHRITPHGRVASFPTFEEP